jgi:hypothetical protein
MFMSDYRSIPLAAFLALGLAAGMARAKGILVKFLPNPAEDSIVRYDVYRSEDSGALGSAMGSIVPTVTDTLRYPDLAVERGRAYFYSVKAVNAGGLESDPSDRTEAGLPLLALPDTLKPDSLPGLARFRLAGGARPLSRAPFALSASLGAADGARLAFRFDTASGWMEFRPTSGLGDTARVIVRGSYYDKFEDSDTMLVIVSAAAPTGTARPHAPASSRAAAPSALRISRDAGGSLRLAGLPRRALVEILAPSGVVMFRGTISGPEARLEDAGYHAGYLTARDGEGRLLGSLSLPLD